MIIGDMLRESSFGLFSLNQRDNRRPLIESDSSGWVLLQYPAGDYYELYIPAMTLSKEEITIEIEGNKVIITPLPKVNPQLAVISLYGNLPTIFEKTVFIIADDLQIASARYYNGCLIIKLHKKQAPTSRINID